MEVLDVIRQLSVQILDSIADSLLIAFSVVSRLIVGLNFLCTLKTVSKSCAYSLSAD